MVSPIRPNVVAPPTAKPAATFEPAAKATPNAGTPSGVARGGGGSGSISVEEQSRIIKAADAKGSGTQGDGLANRDDIFNYLMLNAPKSGSTDSYANFAREAKAKTDAIMAKLDVSHGDAKGGDNLVDDGDVKNNNAVIEYSFTFSNTPAGGGA